MTETDNTLEGIEIVEGLVKTAVSVNCSFTKEQLNSLLDLFGHKTAEGKPYTDPTNLLTKAYKNCALKTAGYFKAVFPWYVIKVDRTLLSLLE